MGGAIAIETAKPAIEKYETSNDSTAKLYRRSIPPLELVMSP